MSLNCELGPGFEPDAAGFSLKPSASRFVPATAGGENIELVGVQ